MTDKTPAQSQPNQSTPNALPTFWVGDDASLTQLTEHIAQQSVIALDTEFIKRSTYYPILALIQVNTGHAIYLIDAPAVDLGKFWQVLASVPTLVWHACGEDLSIFYLLTNSPPLTNVFDVQIGMAYLTGNLQMGYSQAVRTMLGIELDKGESQSDWLMRPLSPQQIRYADEDVRYLLALYEATKTALMDKHTFAYACEDSLLYAKELHNSHHTPDDKLYLDYIAPDYNRLQLGVLQALIVWREQLARANNEPRSFILGKQALREIIAQLPQTHKQLALTTAKRSVIRRYGEVILTIIKKVQALPVQALPQLPPPSYTSKHKPFKSALNDAIATHSQSTQIPSNLLLRQRWINHLLYMVYQELPAQALPDGLMGYRQPWVMETLLPLLYQYKTQIDAGFGYGLLAQNADTKA